jgi:DNA-binding MarR family transcriptional regulator
MQTDRLLIDDHSFAGWWWLAHAYHSMAGALYGFFERWGITGAQFGVLRCLSDAGVDGLMLSDLSRRLMVTCGNTTGVVDRLEQAGYLRRERRPGDRRIVMASLTPEGAELFSRIHPVYLEVVRSQMSGLSAEEKELLARLCERLHHTMEDRRQAADPPEAAAVATE